MFADLDTLLTALYVELTDQIIPLRGFTRSGPGRTPEVTDAELVCIAVAQVLLRYDDERHWLLDAPKLIGPLFPRLLGQSEYNTRLKAAAPLMEAALRWLADATPATAELLRLMDATPVPCGQSVITARRSDLFGYAGYGYCPSHSRWYWGSKLLLMCTCEGTVAGVRAGQPQAVRGTRPGPADAGQPAGQPPGAGHRCGHRQGPVRRGNRGVLHRPRPRPDPGPPGPQRTKTAPQAVPETGCASALSTVRSTRSLRKQTSPRMRGFSAIGDS